jgi:protein-S-isoprenylcysteine O-methyltransferase Ste14
MMIEEYLYYGTFAGVMTCWIGFAAIFFLRKRPAASGESKRDNSAYAGIALEACGYSIVWIFRRKEYLLIDSAGIFAAAFFSLLAVTLAVASVWLVMSAIRHLGKQWAVAARMIEGHRLITDGPYGIVRNPIYTGMLGLLIATGITVSQWWALFPACIIFWAGTLIRIRVEERLLKEAFGGAFEEYAARVPSLIPGVY